jgi:hypothetical protein
VVVQEKSVPILQGLVAQDGRMQFWGHPIFGLAVAVALVGLALLAEVAQAGAEEEAEAERLILEEVLEQTVWPQEERASPLVEMAAPILVVVEAEERTTHLPVETVARELLS